MVCKVDKAMYGLKQSAHRWELRLIEVLKQVDYIVTATDHSVFVKAHPSPTPASIIVTHVDDLLHTSALEGEARALHRHLEKSFPAGVKLKEGLEHDYLGMHISQLEGRACLELSQHKYIDEMLTGCGAVRPASTPCDPSLLLGQSGQPVDKEDYVRRAAQVLYASTHTRPDLRFVAGVLLQHAAAPTESDMANLERCERYILGTRHLVHRIKPTSLELTGWVDAAYATHENGRSHQGALIFLGGALVMASSVRQKIVSKSSTQAELEALSSSTDHILWASEWLKEKGHISGPVTVFQDNQASIRLGEHGYGSSQASKHWNVRHFYVKEAIDRGQVTLKFIGSEQMLADALTKPYPRDLLAAWRTKIGIVPSSKSPPTASLGPHAASYASVVDSRARGVLQSHQPTPATGQSAPADPASFVPSRGSALTGHFATQEIGLIAGHAQRQSS
jgi:hypothetical protein